jgi:hypothetical protein
MCDLAFTGTNGPATLLLVGVAVLLLVAGAVLVLRGRLRGGKAKGAALAVLLLVGGVGLGTVSAPAPAQAADCSSSGSSSGGSGGDSGNGGTTPDTATLTVDPASWTGAVDGDSQAFTVTNTSATVTALDLEPSLTGSSDFVPVTTTCAGPTLAPGASCSFTVGFNDDDPGVATGTFSIAGSNTNTVTVALSGLGETTLSITPTGAAVIPEGAPVVYTITNTGTAAAAGFATNTVFTPSGSEMSVSGGTCDALTTLAAGASCTVEISLTGPDGANGVITATATNVNTPATANVFGEPA